MDLTYEDVLAFLALVLEKTGPVEFSWADFVNDRASDLDFKLEKDGGSDVVRVRVEDTTGGGDYVKLNGRESELVQNPQPIILVATDSDFE